MPVTPTFPDVYIQEKPSGVRTITGVATSITAFVGRTQRGPIGVPKAINSFSDFERIFGGLDVTSRTSYAIRDFNLDGGRQAVIVRLYHGDTTPSKNVAAVEVDNVKLRAASWGKWGANLRLSVDTTGVLPSAATQLAVGADKIFAITVTDVSSGAQETFSNVTLADSARRLDKVLADSSQLVVWQSAAAIGGATAKPLSSGTTGKDATSQKSDAVDAASKDWRAAEEALALASQALAQAIADGKTGSDLKPFNDEVDATTKARDAARPASIPLTFPATCSIRLLPTARSAAPCCWWTLPQAGRAKTPR